MKSKRYIVMVIGGILYSVGINQLQVLDCGMGSFDTLTLQITKLTPIHQFGNASFAIHFIFFITLLMLVRKFGLHRNLLFLSLVSIFILTRLVNLFSEINYYPDKNITVFILTFLILNLGLFLLAKSNLIIAPFDKFLVETADYLNINFGIVRFIADVLLLVLVVLINQLCNGQTPITIFTFVITFLTGLNIGIYEIIYKKSRCF